MSRPGTFERVYAALKERLRRGELRPGERLEPAALSDELNASVTPVRDALHRLTGERLVEAPRHEGFRASVVTESMLRHLYQWHLDILFIAIARQQSAGFENEPPASKDRAHERLNALFAGLAARSGNPEHAAALRNLTDRLGPYQRIEDELLDALEEESESIAGAIRAWDRNALRKSLVRYHRRRERIVPELLDRIHRDG